MGIINKRNYIVHGTSTSDKGGPERLTSPGAWEDGSMGRGLGAHVSQFRSSAPTYESGMKL